MAGKSMKYFQKINDKSKWKEFLGKTLFQTFFHNLQWEEFLEEEFKWLKFEHYLYKSEAVLSLARVNIFGQEKLISHPFCEYGGLLPLSSRIDGEEVKKALFSEFKIPFIISFHPYLLNFFSFSEDGAKKEFSSNTYFIENIHQRKISDIWSSLRKTLRHSIKKGQEQGIEIVQCREEKELKSFYKIYLKTEKRHKGLPYPLSFFRFFLNSPDAEIILAKFNGKIIAGSVFLLYDKFIHYSKNASDERFRHLNANNLILWEEIKKYAGKDYHFFDLGGTGQNNSLKVFKEAWHGKKYHISDISNIQQKPRGKKTKIRNILGILPGFLMERIGPYILRFKV
ncbi:MAG: GNAT family N-acetyltransferase [Candidatus Parcubacteria bacterium]|nr:GNAT family N-acetyltransferase [Candidatus Parcubacteria bacterium]